MKHVTFHPVVQVSGVTTVKISTSCAECGTELKGTLEYLDDGTPNIQVDMCPMCTKHLIEEIRVGE